MIDISQYITQIQQILIEPGLVGLRRKAIGWLQDVDKLQRNAEEVYNANNLDGLLRMKLRMDTLILEGDNLYKVVGRHRGVRREKFAQFKALIDALNTNIRQKIEEYIQQLKPPAEPAEPKFAFSFLQRASSRLCCL